MWHSGCHSLMGCNNGCFLPDKEQTLALPSHKLLPALAAVLALSLTGGCGDSLTGPQPDTGPAPSVALAADGSMEIAFEAVVTAVVDSQAVLGGSVAIGDSVRGWLCYDEWAVDIDSKPDRGKYLFDSAPSGMGVEIAGLLFRSDPDAPALVIRLDNAEPSGNKRDIARFSSSANLMVLPDVGVADMSIMLTDRLAVALSSDSLAGTDPFHAAWDTKRQLTISGNDGWQIVAGIVETIDAGGEQTPREPEGNNKVRFHRD